MPAQRSRSTVSASFVLAVVLAAAISAQTPPRDAVEGGWINFEVGLVHPIEAGPSGTLLALDQPGGWLVVFDRAGLGATSAPIARIRIGPGASSVRMRPGSQHAFVVDRVVGAVFVVDLARRSVVHAIRVGPEPQDLLFAPGNDRAFVTCGGVDALDVIDLRSADVLEARVVRRVPLGVREPRSLAFADGHVWVAPLLSGNNTATRSLAGVVSHSKIARVTAANGAARELPDLDLVAVAPGAFPGSESVDATRSLRGLGTTLFAVAKRPGSHEVWIANTDALNAEVVGEKNALGGQVVRNRVTIVDVQSREVSIIDLDAGSEDGALRAAQPTDIAFSPDGRTAWVAGFGSDAVVTIDAERREIMEAVAIPSSGPWAALPRALLVDAASQRVLVHAQNDVALAILPLAGTAKRGAEAVLLSLGHDPTPDAVRRGRGVFNDARTSASGTSSCASCHIDGHSDLLAWDLSGYADPEGTPDPRFPLDEKGPMVTQTLRGLREVQPYHWRGEKARLEDFNGAFVGLLDRGAPLLCDDFAALKAYLESLVHRPNPRAPLDRSLNADEAEGAARFQSEDLGCAACHQLPLGTQNELFHELSGGQAFAFKVAPLRALADRLLPELDVGGDFGRSGRVSGLGAGLLHNGTIPSIAGFFDHFFRLTPRDAHAIEAFLRGLDTGLAPSSAAVASVDPRSRDGLEAARLLLALAERGDNDLYVLGTTMRPGNESRAIRAVYRREARSFVVPALAAPPLSIEDLLALGARAKARMVFVGVPVGLGERYGIDADLDHLPDGDEASFGARLDDPDSDRDGIPDGVEVLAGGSPADGLPVAPAPPRAPSVVEARVVYATTNTVKLRCRTPGLARLDVAWTSEDSAAQGSLLVPLHGGFDTVHSFVIQGVPPGERLRFRLVPIDAYGQSGAPHELSTSTVILHVPDISRVSSIEAAPLPGENGDPERVEIEVRISGRFGEARPNHTVHLDVWLELDGEPSELVRRARVVTGEGGLARLYLDLPPAVASTPNRAVHVVIPWIDGSLSDAPDGSPEPPVFPYLEPLDLVGPLRRQL